jgi:hypothetical protein
MANMELQTRNQFERVDLSGPPSTGVQLRSRRGLTIYAIVSTVILIVLGYAAIQEVSGWAGAVVFGVILLNLVGLMIAVRPGRKTPWG